MGNCSYCGEKAGFLRTKHKDCETRHYDGVKIIKEKLLLSLASGELEGLKEQLANIANDHYVQPSQIKTLSAWSWDTVLDRFLEDSVLAEDEETRLVVFADHFGLTQDDLETQNEAYTKMHQAKILRKLMSGELPDPPRIIGNIPLNLQKNERIVWIFQNVPYYEDKTKRTYVGRSQGFSVRIAKGVYYRAGAFKGHPVEYQERIHQDTGLLVVTDKHLYFHSPSKSFRISYKKIVSFEPFSNGIGLMRDLQTAKPQIFELKHGPFAYNLIVNLSQMAA